MSWQNYRALKGKGLVATPTVEEGAPGQEQIITMTAQFNAFGERLPSDSREVTSIVEALKVRKDHQEAIADIDAWLEDAIPVRDGFRQENARVKAEIAALERAELEKMREQESETSAVVKAEADSITFHPAPQRSGQ